MKRFVRLFLVLATLGVMAGVAYVAQEREPTSVRMANAAERFVALLSEEQRASACFPFDDPERMNWHFVPLQDKDKKPTRKGLRLEKMTAEQREAAINLLRASLSATGFQKASAIMNLEPLLRELESSSPNMVRDPQWYFFTVFGTPSRTGKWGFRAEGHHLSLNFTLDEGRIVSVTPAVFGANPAVIQQGPHKGTKTISEVDDVAKLLVRSLGEEEKKLAVQDKPFPEIAGKTKMPKVDKPVGLPMSRMTAKQKGLLMDLLRTYTDRMPEEVGEQNLRAAQSTPPEQLFFAFTGGLEQGQKHTYRIQSPTFVVEFLNIQEDSAKNPANHIHSGWRTIGGDFGLAQKTASAAKP